MNNIIKIMKPLEDSAVLIDGLNETVKHEIKKQEVGFLGVLLTPLAASFIKSVISLVVRGWGFRRAERGYVVTNF